MVRSRLNLVLHSCTLMTPLRQFCIHQIPCLRLFRTYSGKLGICLSKLQAWRRRLQLCPRHSLHPYRVSISLLI
eukprot:6066874-Karenia_brevis.AAC.1